MSYERARVDDRINVKFMEQGDLKPVAVLRDRALNGAAIASAVILGLLFATAVVFGSIYFSRTPAVACVAYYNATAAKTVLTMALIAQDISAGCPFSLDENCELSGATSSAWGNLSLRASPATIVGRVTSACTTIGELADPTDGVITTQCNSIYWFNGEGGIDAGIVTAQGLVILLGSQAANVTTDVLGVTGGAGFYVNPSGGTVTITNRTSDAQYVDLSLVLTD